MLFCLRSGFLLLISHLSFFYSLPTRSTLYSQVLVIMEALSISSSLKILLLVIGFPILTSL
jgi:hypothetical protein